MLSQNDLEITLDLRLNSLLAGVDGSLGSNKDTVVLPVYFAAFVVDVVHLLVDHDAKGTRHGFCDAGDLVVFLKSRSNS